MKEPDCPLFVQGRLELIRRGIVCLCVATGVLGLASTATAAECGKPVKAKKGKAAKGKKAGKPRSGALLLRAEESTTELNFKRDTDKKRLIFVFDVKGCRLPADAGKAMRVKIRSSDLEVEDVFGNETIEAEGSVLTVEVVVKPEEFDPGSYSAAVTIQGKRITPTTSKVSLQRTEGWFFPFLIFLGCALTGWFAALLVCADGTRAGFKKLFGHIGPWKGLAAALVAAGAVWWAGYVQVDVWELDLETVGILVIGALPAAYGAGIRILQTKAK